MQRSEQSDLLRGEGDDVQHGDEAALHRHPLRHLREDPLQEMLHGAHPAKADGCPHRLPPH